MRGAGLILVLCWLIFMVLTYAWAVGVSIIIEGTV